MNWEKKYLQSIHLIKDLYQKIKSSKKKKFTCRKGVKLRRKWVLAVFWFQLWVAWDTARPGSFLQFGYVRVCMCLYVCTCTYSVVSDWSDLAHAKCFLALRGACMPAESCLTPRDPMDCSPPGSAVHGILEARILVWVTSSSSRGSSWPRDQTCLSCVSDIGSQILYR